MTSRALNYGNYGIFIIFIIMGNAGFISSTVVTEHKEGVALKMVTSRVAMPPDITYLRC